LTPETPRVSIIVPVLNESAGINDLVAHIRATDTERISEIIVVDGSADGETLRAIQDSSVVRVKSDKGRAKQMNEGARAARGSILLFLHADTELPEAGLSLIATAMDRNRFAAGGAFDLGIKSARPAFRLIESMASLRSRITRVPFGDQALFMRSEYFRAIGGYRDIPLMEDVEIMRRIRKKGNKICIIPHKVLTSPRRWEKDGILCCTVRNWLLQLLYCLGAAPSRLARWYKQ